MQPNNNVSVHSDMLPKGTIMRVAKKEVALFFASPVAYLFLATFAAITLFIFFWGSRSLRAIFPMCVHCLNGCRYCWYFCVQP